MIVIKLKIPKIPAEQSIEMNDKISQMDLKFLKISIKIIGI